MVYENRYKHLILYFTKNDQPSTPPPEKNPGYATLLTQKLIKILYIIIVIKNYNNLINALFRKKFYQPTVILKVKQMTLVGISKNISWNIILVI
jgi:hypothetical protein